MNEIKLEDIKPSVAYFVARQAISGEARCNWIDDITMAFSTTKAKATAGNCDNLAP